MNDTNERSVASAAFSSPERKDMAMVDGVNEGSAAMLGSLAGIAPVIRKPAAYIVEVDGIGSIMPLCRDTVEVDGVRSRFADRVRKIIPLYAWSDWDEIRKAGDRVAREEGFKVMEMELNALHAENARLRWRLAAAEIRQSN
jgi:hypothetical protein